MKNIKTAFFALVIVGISYSCQSKAPVEESTGMPADFTEFYQKFHTDSIYQMEHISFPLDGIPALQMSKNKVEDFKYLKSEWILHKPIIDSLIMYQSLEMLSENIVQEEIGIDNSGLMIFRRYSKVGKEWYLIYYMGPNFVKK